VTLIVTVTFNLDPDNHEIRS